MTTPPDPVTLAVLDNRLRAIVEGWIERDSVEKKLTPLSR